MLVGAKIIFSLVSLLKDQERRRHWIKVSLEWNDENHELSYKTILRSQIIFHDFSISIIIVSIHFYHHCPCRRSALPPQSLALKMAQNTTPSTQKIIVILGGSYAGVSIAHYLLKHVVTNLPDSESYQVIIVSTSSETMCRPACPRALISDDMFNQERLFVSIPKVFEQYSKGSFRFIHGTAMKLDHTKRLVSVRLANGDMEKIDFCALVIATGASTSSPLLGLNRDEQFLRSNWAAFRKALPGAKSSK